MDDKGYNEALNKFIKSSLEGMTKHFMQGFELLASQLGGKSTPGSSSSSPHDEKKTNGEAIFSKTVPHNRPQEFKNQTGTSIPNFLESKEGPYTTYDVREATNNWQQLSDECRKVLPFGQFIRASLQFKQGGNENREPSS